MHCPVCKTDLKGCKPVESIYVAPIDIPEIDVEPGKGIFVSQERLYLDKAGKVVGAKDPNRASLLVAAKGKLSLADARKYGLIPGGPAPEVRVEDVNDGGEEGFPPADGVLDSANTRLLSPRRRATRRRPYSPEHVASPPEAETLGVEVTEAEPSEEESLL